MSVWVNAAIFSERSVSGSSSQSKTVTEHRHSRLTKPEVRLFILQPAEFADEVAELSDCLRLMSPLIARPLQHRSQIERERPLTLYSVSSLLASRFSFVPTTAKFVSLI